MTFTFEINDYLTETDKYELARDAFKTLCINKFKTDAERIFSNAAYTAVAEMVDQQMDGNLSEIIRDKAIGVINKLSSVSVFSPPNAWDRESSKGFDILQKHLDDSAPLIKARVEAIIGNLESGYITDRLNDLMYQVVEDRLIGKKPE